MIALSLSSREHQQDMVRARNVFHHSKLRETTVTTPNVVWRWREQGVSSLLTKIKGCQDLPGTFCRGCGRRQ